MDHAVIANINTDVSDAASARASKKHQIASLQSVAADRTSTGELGAAAVWQIHAHLLHDVHREATAIERTGSGCAPDVPRTNLSRGDAGNVARAAAGGGGLNGASRFRRTRGGGVPKVDLLARSDIFIDAGIENQQAAQAETVFLSDAVQGVALLHGVRFRIRSARERNGGGDQNLFPHTRGTIAATSGVWL